PSARTLSGPKPVAGNNQQVTLRASDPSGATVTLTLAINIVQSSGLSPQNPTASVVGTGDSVAVAMTPAPAPTMGLSTPAPTIPAPPAPNVGAMVSTGATPQVITNPPGGTTPTNPTSPAPSTGPAPTINSAANQTAPEGTAVGSILFRASASVQN